MPGVRPLSKKPFVFGGNSARMVKLTLSVERLTIYPISSLALSVQLSCIEVWVIGAMLPLVGAAGMFGEKRYEVPADIALIWALFAAA